MHINLSNEEAAYWGAAIDGEGTLTLIWGPNNCVQPKLAIANTDLRWIEELKNKFGGTISTKNPRKATHKVCYQWFLNGRAIKNLLPQLQPYIKLKARQAEIVMEVTNSMSELGVNVSSEIRARRTALLFEIRELNGRGPICRR